MTATIPGPHARTRPPKATAPDGACDCHFHVFGPENRYPYSASRGYTPPDAALDDYRAMLDVLGVSRAVIVQPSVYGTDNACSLDAAERLGEAGRGVAVLDETVGDAELDRLHAAGFRGTRFNIESAGGVPEAQLEAVAARVAPRGWHVQVYVDGRRLPELAPRLAGLPTEVVIDHMGAMDPAAGTGQPGLAALRELLGTGRCWVKLSGAYRIDPTSAPFGAATPIARALIEAAPDRLVWGSDWPHPQISGPMPDDGDLFDWFLDATGDVALRRRILVDNPARLYDFAGPALGNCGQTA